MKLKVEVSDETFAALEAALLKIQTQVAGERPGEIVIKPVFPDAEAWLSEIVAQNIAQLVPEQPAAEALALLAQAEALQKQAAEMTKARRGISVRAERTGVAK